LKNPVELLVETAARRHLYLSALEHSALALGAVLTGVILLLLLGTQILNWPWLVLLAAAGLTLAFVRIRRGLLSEYRIAQLVDHRLRSHDVLSTAWFLLRERPALPDAFARSQIQTAERLVPGVEPRSLFPLVWRRSWTFVCALAAVAFGLFALRYLVTQSLDFRASLLPVPAFSPVVALERLERLLAPHHTGTPDADQLAKLNLPETGLPRDHESPSHQSGKSVASQQPGQRAGDKQSAASGRADSKGDARARNGDAPSPSSQSRDKNGSAEQTNRSSDGNKSSPSSLSDRMRDALSGLMEKMRSQSNNSGNREQGGQQASNQNNGGDTRNPQAAENGQTSQTNSQGANREQNAQAAGQPQAMEKAAPQSASAAQGGSKKGSDSQSGIGRQDGEKTLREAEQLRAMGKLDEIIGKRSAALTGDMKLETRSSQQQLQTQYSGRIGHHTDSGGLIEHEDVPLALQNYVRTYMEQVHKQANEPR
jgi:hypothetical protein